MCTLVVLSSNLGNPKTVKTICQQLPGSIPKAKTRFLSIEANNLQEQIDTHRPTIVAFDDTGTKTCNALKKVQKAAFKPLIRYVGTKQHGSDLTTVHGWQDLESSVQQNTN